MAQVTCTETWTDGTKLGCRSGKPNIEAGEDYEKIKEYLYKNERWYILKDPSDGRILHAPKSKFE